MINTSKLATILEDEGLIKTAGRIDQDMYDLGREDSFASIRPQSPDGDYMMGYNEAQEDAGLRRMQPPSGGRGKKLDPDLLKGAVIPGGKRHRELLKKRRR